ncbi:hypothetical protein EXIGLDRAFT_834058 [Exidia glandulosa HHB12029]|uniref:Uncharacterized protein n=1 Tax=Exidia glandulosa HHB12029 TaxID=1314781 RepID=A0A165K790_EXIGL|nr:hypothetical protein EXIGLDRAFT_834058 [Exidia glandulosa HHB12029]
MRSGCLPRGDCTVCLLSYPILSYPGYTDPPSNPELPVLDTDIFCSVAPLLREVTLSNILPPFDLLCFANVDRVRIGYSTPEEVVVQETDLFKTFPRLRFLSLCGQMSLEQSMHPFSVRESGWQALDCLELNGVFHPEYRTAPNLKLDGIPTKLIRSIDIDAIGPSEAQIFMDDLPGQLELSIAGLADHVAGLNALVRPCIDIDSLGMGEFTFHVTSALPSCALVRGTKYTNDKFQAAGHLFYKASHRLTTLCIPIEVLHGLADYIPHLAALTTLRFIVDKKPDDYDSGHEDDDDDGPYEPIPDVWTLVIQRFRILCPVLTLFELWFSAMGCRLRCAVAEVVVFVQNTLPESIGPLTLRLYNVDLIGHEDALKPRIVRVEHM